ncbi:MAG: hypothetical protein WCX46_03025 [Candidatus Paceibacterota bacterium]
MKNTNRGLASVFIIIIILGVLVVGGGIYFLNKNSNSILEDNSKEESYFSENAADMFKKDKPIECSSKASTPEGSVESLFYFDSQNKMVRVEMKIVNNNNPISSNTTSIIRDGWNYFWDDLMNKDGMKVKLEEGEDISSSIQENVSADLGKDFNFVCKIWKVDSSKFELPKDKNFKDLSNLGDDLLNSSNLNNVSNTDLCNMCNMIPTGDEKNECLKSCKQQR